MLANTAAQKHASWAMSLSRSFIANSFALLAVAVMVLLAGHATPYAVRRLAGSVESVGSSVARSVLCPVPFLISVYAGGPASLVFQFHGLFSFNCRGLKWRFRRCARHEAGSKPLQPLRR